MTSRPGCRLDLQAPGPEAEAQRRLGVLLHGVGEPAGAPADGEHRLPGVGAHAPGEGQRPQREVRRWGPRRCGRRRRRARRRPRRRRAASKPAASQQVEEGRGPGVAVGVQRVAEPGQPVAVAQPAARRPTPRRRARRRPGARGPARSRCRAAGRRGRRSPAPTAAYGLARVEAATRTANVDVASSWSAHSTSAPLRARTAASVGTCVATAGATGATPARRVGPAAREGRALAAGAGGRRPRAPRPGRPAATGRTP